ncbi:MAG: hypothetical protein JRN21_03255 [Nitrososphaerota archaeon]|nr:hypothetical protein [Nitrososphaerota archaeon]
MKEDEWERLLLSSTEAVMRRLAPLARRGGRGTVIGVGAAGDKTIYADKKAEDILLKHILRAGGAKVLTEEAGSVGDDDAAILAIVDPLDGSSNFEHGIPFYCTSVALADGRTMDDVRVGVVRDLVTGDVYAARRGKGATKNGKTIRTSRTADPSTAVVGVDLSGTRERMTARQGPLIEGVKRQVHLGANALELCYLAEGKTDAFVDLRGKMRVTDFAAAGLIALEAGAVLTDPRGRRLSPEFDLEHRFNFVASANGELHRKILWLCRAAVR